VSKAVGNSVHSSFQTPVVQFHFSIASGGVRAAVGTEDLEALGLVASLEQWEIATIGSFRSFRNLEAFSILLVLELEVGCFWVLRSLFNEAPFGL